MFQYGTKNSRLEKSHRDQGSELKGSQNRHQSVLLEQIHERDGLRKDPNMRSKSNILRSPDSKGILAKDKKHLTSQNQSQMSAVWPAQKNQQEQGFNYSPIQQRGKQSKFQKTQNIN
jgi:hypothetical protein